MTPFSPSHNKNAPAQLNRRAFFPLEKLTRRSSFVIRGVRAADNPARLPLASSGRLSAALPFCSSTVWLAPFPRKSPPSLRCKAPPPKRLATVVFEPDPNCFLPFYPFAFVVGTRSNDCASDLQANCRKAKAAIPLLNPRQKTSHAVIAESS